MKVVTATEEIDPGNLKHAREVSGLSGRALGRATGVHENYISRLERGEIQEVSKDFITKCIRAMAGHGEFKGRPQKAVRSVIRGELRFPRRPEGPAYKA